MSEGSKIEWCDDTFNPWWGCFPVSSGCALCYAERDAKRYGHSTLWEKTGPRRTFGEKHWNEPRRWNDKAAKEGGRRRIFSASMGDIGDPHPTCEEERPKLWKLVEETPSLIWLLLTKRIETARSWLPAPWLKPGGWPTNAWLGVSAENQEMADARIPALLELPSPVHWASYEPALGPVNFRRIPLEDGFFDALNGWHWIEEGGKTLSVDGPRGRLDQVIVGGESGTKARPFHLEWARDVVQQCADAEAACFVKQFGYRPFSALDRISYRGYDGRFGPQPQGFSRYLNAPKGGDMAEWPEDLRVRQFPVEARP